MQTTAIRTVTNSLPENEVILLTLLISKRYIIQNSGNCGNGQKVVCKLAVAVGFHLMTMRLVIFSLNLVGIKIAITKTNCNYWSVIVYKQIHLL